MNMMGTLALSPERQSARMSRITNDGLTRSGIQAYDAFIAVPMVGRWHYWWRVGSTINQRSEGLL